MPVPLRRLLLDGGTIPRQNRSHLPTPPTSILLARALAASAEGLTLDEMAAHAGFDRRTAEQERPRRVVLRFSPEAAEDARRFLFHPTQVFDEQDDGSLLVRFTAGSLLELARHLFAWGTEVDVLAPTALRSRLRRELEAAWTHHAAKRCEQPGCEDKQR